MVITGFQMGGPDAGWMTQTGQECNMTTDQGPGYGWWQASDGNWYPPETHPWRQLPPPTQPAIGSPTGQMIPMGAVASESPIPSWVLPVHVSVWALVSGYLGLVSLILLGIPGPFAVWTGIVGLRQIRRNPGQRGLVRCWVGIVCGAFDCLMLLIFLVAALG